MHQMLGKALMHFCFVSYRLIRIANQINRELLFIILQTVFTTTTAQWSNFTVRQDDFT